MIHNVEGTNFHGLYRITLRGPAEGFRLSAAQTRKVKKALCGVKDCKCAGDRLYGTEDEGPPEAQVVEQWASGIGDSRIWVLIPAGTATAIGHRRIA